MLDDTADELFIDLAADEAKDFAPVVVAAVGVEEVDELLFGESSFDVETLDEFGGAEVLEEGAVDEGVGVGTEEAEDEVAFA